LKSCKTKTNPKFGDTLFSRTSEFSTHQNNLILAFHQFEAYWLSKTMAVIPRLFKEDFALTFFESEAKHRFCFRGCRSVLDQIARIWFLCLLSSGGLQDDVISISLLANKCLLSRISSLNTLYSPPTINQHKNLILVHHVICNSCKYCWCSEILRH
jgi:hypothetical protein